MEDSYDKEYPPTQNAPLKEGVKAKRRWPCSVDNCGFSASTSKDLSRHMRKHTGERPFVCETCGKAYTRSDKLTTHIRVHRNLKPFKCKLCPYATVDSGYLTKHMMVHNDSRPHKCQMCPYAARESSRLAVHLRSHTGDCPFTCMEKGCDAAFKTLSDLKRHSRLHSGDKPYSCSFCEYKSAVKGNLNSHIRKIHKDISTTSSSPTISPAKVKPKKKKTSLVEVTEEQQYVSNVCDVDFASVYSVPEPLPNESSGSGGQKTEDSHKNPPRIVMIVKNNAVVTIKDTSAPEADTLPFQYACKQCPYKANALKTFSAHLKKFHKASLERTLVTDEESQHPRSVGRPRMKRILRSLKGGELETFFDCTMCNASFVREDSLRCHSRQHQNDPINSNNDNQSSISNQNPQFLGFLSVAPSSTSGDGGLFTSSYPNLSFPNFSNGDSSDGDGVRGLQSPKSVITENPAHLFVMSSNSGDGSREVREQFVIS